MRDLTKRWFGRTGRRDKRNAAFALLSCASVLAAQEPPVTTLPQTVVTAQKAPEDLMDLPLSVTAVAISPLTTDWTTVKEVSSLAPGVFINQFSASALSNPFFRGVGGSPANPGVTTYIDGVPQLNSYSSNIELIDVERVEFVRGPQGALFGRNTPGGMIHILSARPSDQRTGYGEARFGNYSLMDFRGGVSGPVSEEKLSMSVAAGYTERDGYTENLWDGDDVDSRERLFGKTQVLFTPWEKLDVRLILSGERDRDGDYALGDLDFIRAHPHKVAHDFTGGYNDRDIVSPTLIAHYKGESLDFTSTTGYVYWKNDGLTDLDYGYTTPEFFFPYSTRSNVEQQDQVTQEFRVASPAEQPITLNESVNLAWQGGVFLFHQDYEQDTANVFAPPLANYSGTSGAELENSGLGVYGQGRLEFWEKLGLALGVRWDWEDKEATLASGSALGNLVADGEDSFSEWSPQVGLTFKFTPEHMLFASAASGYKAGGFNPPPAGFAAPPGSESYDPEHSWNYEAGYKARVAGGKIQGSLAFFYIDWEDLQLNQQYPGAGGQYYIGNAGAATSQGIELEGAARPWTWLDVFASAAVMDTGFRAGSTAYNANAMQNENVGGNELPYAPDFTASTGAEARWSVCPKLTLFLRAQATATGEFQYDAVNGESQDTFVLADFRGGLRGRHWFAEGWVANAFDEDYVPIAIQYGQLGALSGYVGESGAPMTFGLRLGLHF